MIEALIKLGLSDKEARVYVATLELGEDTVQNIAKKSGVNRATTYVILEKLLGLGLVSLAPNEKKTFFVAEDPAELANLLEEQKREVEGKRKYLDEVMSQLKAIHNVTPNKPIVRYFQGVDGLEALDRYGVEQFPPNSEMLSLIPIDIIEERFPRRRNRAVDERVRKGIKARSIYSRAQGRLTEEVNQKELREAIYIPREQFPLQATIAVHTNWGIKLYYFDEQEPYGVLIQSPELASNLKFLFELAWKGAQLPQE